MYISFASYKSLFFHYLKASWGLHFMTEELFIFSFYRQLFISGNVCMRRKMVYENHIPKKYRWINDGKKNVYGVIMFIRNHNVRRINQNSNGSHDILKYNNSN